MFLAWFAIGSAFSAKGEFDESEAAGALSVHPLILF
jgi:hypothetical protein